MLGSEAWQIQSAIQAVSQTSEETNYDPRFPTALHIVMKSFSSQFRMNRIMLVVDPESPHKSSTKPIELSRAEMSILRVFTKVEY